MRHLGQEIPQKPLLTQYFSEGFDSVSGICTLLEEEESLCCGPGVVRDTLQMVLYRLKHSFNHAYHLH